MTDHFSEGTTVAAPCSVLIIEDNADGRESLRTLLQLLGYRVEVAIDGVQAVEKGLAIRPMAAIVDIGLPRLNGYQVAQRLRAALGDSVTLIAHSAYSQRAERILALAAGFDALVAKPAELDEIIRWLPQGPCVTAASA
jgi:two-component system, sensor histidine kinase